ncbi:reverse transcriptase domain-containing protein [Tanacetum coccineum]
MRTRNSYFPNNSNVTILRRRNKGRAPNIVEPELRTIVAPMAERTMEELLRAPTEGYGEAIVLPEINADHFEIKTNLLQLVQANPFYGRESENPHAHINSFKRITSTLRFRNVPNDVIKLMMFPYSLKGAAKTCEAWERFKELLRACPHHGFTELTQVDTFYNGLNENEQDSLNAAAGGNLLSKTTREALNIIENKSKVRYSRNRSNASRMNATSSKTDERIDKLADQLSTLVEIVSKKIVTPAPVKAVEESCVTCGGTHSWYNCPATDNNQASVCATTGTYNQVNPPNRVSNQMAPPGFAPVQNNGQNSNSIPNPKGEMKANLTRSGVAYEGPSIPTNHSPKKVGERETEETTDKEQTNFQGITAQITPPVIPISIPEPDVPMTFTKTIPSPEFEVSKKDLPNLSRFALRHMPRFALTIKSLLMNKEKLLELAKIQLNVELSRHDPQKASESWEILASFLFHVISRDWETFGVVLIHKADLEYLSLWEILFEDRSILGFSQILGGILPRRLEPFTSEFILEEIEAYLKDDSISPEIDHADCDPEEDICLIEKLLNNDPFQLPPMDLKQSEVTEAKSSIEEPFLGLTIRS